MKSVIIKKRIEIKKRKIDELRKELAVLLREVDQDEELLRRVTEQEREKREKEFFHSLGIPEYNPNLAENNQKVSRQFIIFTNQAEFVKVTHPDEFQHYSELENWLKKEKLYAHRLSSFASRHDVWYNRSLREKLENLGWAFSHKGVLKGTAW